MAPDRQRASGVPDLQGEPFNAHIPATCPNKRPRSGPIKEEFLGFPSTKPWQIQLLAPQQAQRTPAGVTSRTTTHSGNNDRRFHLPVFFARTWSLHAGAGDRRRWRLWNISLWSRRRRQHGLLRVTQVEVYIVIIVILIGRLVIVFLAVCLGYCCGYVLHRRVRSRGLFGSLRRSLVTLVIVVPSDESA